jgi:hypothetical protein
LSRDPRSAVEDGTQRTELVASVIGQLFVNQNWLMFNYFLLQWFVDTRVMGQLACQAVRDGDLRLEPDTYTAVWDNFLSEEKNR